MPDKSSKQAKSQKPTVPKTDVSQHDDKSTRRFVFWMVAIIVVIILVGGAILYWLIGQYVNQSNKNKSQDITIGLLEKKEKDIQLLKPNYEKIIASSDNGKSDADRILSAMPKDQGYSELIAMLENMGAQSGIKISTISKAGEGEVAQSPSPSSYETTVSMESDFNKILDFLRKTENSARVLDFSSMTLSGSTKSGQVSSTVTFKAYYQTPADINPTTKDLQ